MRYSELRPQTSQKTVLPDPALPKLMYLTWEVCQRRGGLELRVGALGIELEGKLLERLELLHTIRRLARGTPPPRHRPDTQAEHDDPIAT